MTLTGTVTIIDFIYLLQLTTFLVARMQQNFELNESFWSQRNADYTHVHVASMFLFDRHVLVWVFRTMPYSHVSEAQYSEVRQEHYERIFRPLVKTSSQSRACVQRRY